MRKSIALSLGLLFGAQSASAQLNTAPLPTPRPIGVGSESLNPPGPSGFGPHDQMHVHGFAVHPTQEGKRPAYRLSYGDESSVQSLISQWGVSTFNGHHSTIATTNDIVLKTNENVDDLIFSTVRGTAPGFDPRSGDGSAIRFGTSAVTFGPQQEHMTILSNGHIGVSKVAPRSTLHLSNELTFGQNGYGNFIGSNYYYGPDYLTPTTVDPISIHTNRRANLNHKKSAFMYFNTDQALRADMGWVHPINAGGTNTELNTLNGRFMYFTSDGHLVVNHLGHIGAFSKNNLELHGNAAIGNNYARAHNAPPNGMLVEGSVVIGTTSPIDPTLQNSIPQPPDFSPSDYATDPNSVYKLVVNGSVLAKEVMVTTEWADFVFDDGYELRSLEDVEAHINDFGHLPDVPSAADVEVNGISIGASQANLLQKIEELTLYLIEANKRIKALEAGAR